MAIHQLIGSTDGEHVRLGKALGTRRMLPATATGGSFGLVEHDLPARQLGSPIRTHEREDEYSYVLSGRLTAKVGDDVIDAGPGELVVKPRGISHAFWNTGAEPVRFLELISPGGFEEYFFELAAPFNARDEQAMGAVRDRYRLDIRPETIPSFLNGTGCSPRSSCEPRSALRDESIGSKSSSERALLRSRRSGTGRRALCRLRPPELNHERRDRRPAKVGPSGSATDFGAAASACRPKRHFRRGLLRV